MLTLMCKGEKEMLERALNCGLGLRVEVIGGQVLDKEFNRLHTTLGYQLGIMLWI